MEAKTQSPNIELHRSFRLSGRDIDGFFDAIQAMEACTTSVVVSSDQLGLAAVVNDRNAAFDIAITLPSQDSLSASINKIMEAITKYEDDDKLTIYYCDSTSKFSLKALDLRTFAAKPGVTPELVSELRNGSKTLIMVPNGKTCVVSDLAFSTLNNRAKISGDAMGRPCVGRIVELAKAFFRYQPQDLTLIIRSNRAANIIVAAHSGKYTYVPQSALRKIYEQVAINFGRVRCLYWEVNHEISQCYIGFPEIAKEFAATYSLPARIIPGLHLSTSDSGDGSLTIRGIWDINGHRAGGPCVKRNHRGEIDVQKLVDDARKTIFAEFSAIPQRLAELLTIDVKDPEKVLRHVFSEVGFTKAQNLGRKASKILYEELVNELEPAGRYTAYDLAMAIATIPERCIGMHYSVVEKMENLVSAAIFADYSMKKKVKVNDAFFLA